MATSLNLQQFKRAMMEALSTYPVDGTVKNLIKTAKVWNSNATRLESQFMAKNRLSIKDIARIKVVGELFDWPTPDSEVYKVKPVTEDSFV